MGQDYPGGPAASPVPFTAACRGYSRRIFAWMTPGEVKAFDLDQEAEAGSWIAG
jgi:hypothetical protein